MLTNTTSSDLLKYGGILGIIYVAMSAITYAMGVDFMMSYGSWISLIVLIGAVVYFGLQVRKNEGGYLTYGDAFKAILIILLVANVIGVVYQIILFNVIDTELAETMKAKAIETAESMWDKFNVPDDKREVALKDMESQEFGPVSFSGIMKQLLFAAIFSVIIAAIIAAFVKKKQPAEF